MAGITGPAATTCKLSLALWVLDSMQAHNRNICEREMAVWSGSNCTTETPPQD